MHSLTTFDKSAEDDPQTVALRELEDFLEKPQSIGLGNLKESLRNIVQLALELKGYQTGLSLQHLVHGEHSSMAMDGLLSGDKKKKRLLKQFWDDMNEIANEMARSFNIIFDFAVKQVVEIKQEISEEIAIIDAKIEEQADTEIEAAAMKAASAKRKKLVKFKKHVKKKEALIQEASTTQEILEIQNDIIEDRQDFKEGRFDPNKTRPNPLTALGDMLEVVSAKNDPKYSSETENKIDTETMGNGSSDGDDASGSSESGGGNSDDSSSTSGEEGRKDEGKIIEHAI